MKLAVSNIAWGDAAMPGFLELLGALGCDGVELAPSLIWPEPVDAPARERSELRSLVEGSGLAVVGFHALLYTRPDLALFDTEVRRGATADYLKRLAELCGDVGGRTLVFGSPSGRARRSLPLDQALEIAAPFFHDVAESCADDGVTLLIEPLTRAETDFIDSTEEGASLVERVAHPHFRLHLDAKSVLDDAYTPAESVARALPMLEHVHASAPGLGPPESGPSQEPFGSALLAAGYGGFVSLEMRRSPGAAAGSIERGVSCLRRWYTRTA